MDALGIPRLGWQQVTAGYGYKAQHHCHKVNIMQTAGHPDSSSA